MDPVALLELAKQTITYVSPLIAATPDSLSADVQQLARTAWQLLQRRFQGDQDAIDELEHYAKKPDHPGRQAAVVAQIVVHFEHDPLALAELARLLKKARHLNLEPQQGGGRTHTQTISGHAQVGTAIAGDVHGNITVGPSTFGGQRMANTEGSDYAEDNIDKRQGAFVRGGTVYGPVIGVNSGTSTVNYHGTAPSAPSASQPAPTRDLVPEMSSAAALPLHPTLDMPATVLIGSAAQLTVRVADVSPIIVATGPLEVVLDARGFAVACRPRQPFVLSATGSGKLRFVVTAQRLGPQALRVDIEQRGQVIASAFAPTRVVAPEGQPCVLAQSTDAPLPAPAVDLELRIAIDQDDADLLHFTLHSPNHRAPFHNNPMGSVRLRTPPRETLQRVYQELSGLARARPADAQVVADQQQRISQVGRRLWEELIPASLQVAYWQLTDTVQTLQITSDEPWIPWELIKPFRFAADGGRLDQPYFCERFSLARWLTHAPVAPTLRISRVQPVAPRTSDLTHIASELERLQRLTAYDSAITVAAPIDHPAHVVALFEAGDVQLLHIAAHGGFDSAQPDNAAIKLSAGMLTPSDITAWFDGQLRSRPLVCINACHGARAAFAFTGLGGWADRLVRRTHVGAFIGAAWEVNDQLALLFVETFYSALLRDGVTIGESFRAARQVVRDAEPSNSTWLAYVLYADPLARVVRAEEGLPND